jgi:hypothetical protein
MSTVDTKFETPLDLIKSLPTEQMTEDEIVAKVKKQFPWFNPLPADVWYAKSN